MRCCYGLIKTNVEDLFYMLHGHLQVLGPETKKLANADPVVVLGTRRLGSVKHFLADARVLVLDTKVRMSHLTLSIADEHSHLTPSKLKQLLATDTAEIRFQRVRDPIKAALKANAAASVLHLFLNVKYKTKDTELQAKFSKAFLNAIDGDCSGLVALAPVSSKPLLEYLASEHGRNLRAALAELRAGVQVELVAINYNVPAFDLRYLMNKLNI